MTLRTGNVATGQLRSIVERIEKLSEEKAAIAADINDVLAEDQGNGFEKKAIRAVLKLRKMDAHERNEQEHMVDLYCRALGLLPELEDEDVDAAA